MLIRVVPVLFILALVGGCGSAPSQQAVPPPSPVSATEPSDRIKQALYAQYQEWRGTPYEYGGLGRDGVDCSGFVYLTLQNRFGSIVPRTTEDQVDVGRSVNRGSWQAGDLVFFRTGHRKRHVGIYVENGYFLHASTSEGVTLSSLEAPYWKSRYWTTRRVRH